MAGYNEDARAIVNQSNVDRSCMKNIVFHANKVTKFISTLVSIEA